MTFVEMRLKGAYLIEPERIEDERGYFARTLCKNEFEATGLEWNSVQCSVSFNRKRGTLRGLHFQIEPYQEVKLVRCTRGEVFDVIVDLRPDSSTFRQWQGTYLGEEDGRMLYIPKGFANGFETMEDSTEIFYQISEFFRPEYSRGVRWDDPELNIDWPLPVTVISPRDSRQPTLSECQIIQ